MPLLSRLVDAIATEAFNLFAAGAYFGLWEGMEIYLNTYYLDEDGLGISALETVVRNISRNDKIGLTLQIIRHNITTYNSIKTFTLLIGIEYCHSYHLLHSTIHFLVSTRRYRG